MKGTWRQEQARENLHDHLVEWRSESEAESLSAAVEDTIGIATTVKITQDALDAMDEKVSAGDIHGGAVALLEALGFEVVQ